MKNSDALKNGKLIAIRRKNNVRTGRWYWISTLHSEDKTHQDLLGRKDPKDWEAGVVPKGQWSVVIEDFEPVDVKLVKNQAAKDNEAKLEEIRNSPIDPEELEKTKHRLATGSAAQLRRDMVKMVKQWKIDMYNERLAQLEGTQPKAEPAPKAEPQPKAEPTPQFDLASQAGALEQAAQELMKEGKFKEAAALLTQLDNIK